jgi:aminoglycoside phosphotransferase (APT) family kinase protein
MEDNPVAPSLPLLRELLQQTIGSQVQVVTVHPLQQRIDYHVLRLTLRHPSLKVVVKLAGPHAPFAAPFDRTAQLHRVVAARTRLIMPEVLAVDVSYRAWPWRYLITTYLPGQEWAVIRPQLTPEERREADRQLGQAIGELHTIPFPSFGEVAPDSTVSPRQSYLEVLAERARRLIPSPRLADLFVQVLVSHAERFAEVSQARLCHEDLHAHNLLFQRVGGRWCLVTILDFDKAWAGHQESDLARLELWRGMVGEGFWPAYQAFCPLATSYPLRRPLYQLMWCLEYAQATPDHLADTYQACLQVGIPPVTSFE